MYYFYCPNCNTEMHVEKLPKGTAGNIRDGYGMPIHHYECPECHNLDAGFMFQKENTSEEQKYYRHVIGMYQGIRGYGGFMR